MKRLFLLPLCRLALSLAAVLLTSCVYYDSYSDGYQGSYGPGSYGHSGYGNVPPYGTYGHSYPISYDLGRRYPAYSHGGYGRSIARCYRCGYSPCRCGSLHHYGRTGVDPHRYGHGERSSHSESSRSDADLKHRPNSYQIVGGSVGRGRSQPKGYHSVDWYERRGYDVDRLKLRNEKGDYHKEKSSGKKKK